MKKYYQMTAKQVRYSINGYEEPLAFEDVKRNQQLYGLNELEESRKKSPVQIFLEQFKDFLVIILILSAIVSGLLGDIESTIVILAVITMNAILGTVQTLKAEQSLNSLKKLSGPQAKVLRDGDVALIETREITVGDIVLLEAGDAVPADGRITECYSLKIDESALTGESLPATKNSDPINGEAPLGDRVNMVYSGSFVTYGRGTFIVTDIGMRTEVGKIAALMKSTSEKKTPLQISLDQFGRKLSVIILVFCALLFGISVFRGENIGNAIPEALSSIVTIVLSFGTQKMAREHAIIRKLQAVEGLGSVSVICSDKTGTLTQNKMTVEQYYVGGRQIEAGDIDTRDAQLKQLLVYSVLCNDSTSRDGVEIGDPTETALVNLATALLENVEKIRHDYERKSEIPFDSDRKLMTTVHDIDGKNIMIVKGAVDVLMNRMSHIQRTVDSAYVKGNPADNTFETAPITQEDLALIHNQNQLFSENGLRVLAFAYKEIGAGIKPGLEDENNLTFLGLISMMDPPRVESKAAVEECIRAGIKPIMITGDHKVTAAAIAKRIGILKDMPEACEGADIDNLSDEELKTFVEGISVYARVSPEHKIRIVRAWQEKGNIVSMTGDGVNDAPALKQADIGVAMGITGTEVSKDAADMILTDDNFATIVKAVENGRNVYKNIKSAIQFLLSGNLGGILTVLYASIAGLSVPFAPVHLLFINLLTDSLPAIALGLEPHSASVMAEKPRPAGEGVMTKEFLLRTGVEGLVIAVMTIVGFMTGLKAGGAVLGSTMAFGTLCLSRLVHGFNCKSGRPVLFTGAFFNNKYLLGAFVAGFALITCVLTIPVLQPVFKVVSLSFNELMTVYALAFANLPIVQLIKLVMTRKK
ncbi:MAG: cation-translocating P-type ATPase [Eubacteriales bacterium]|nr:cation-translocating P-type ATPase [Eubacteriales bacterium]